MNTGSNGAAAGTAQVNGASSAELSELEGNDFTTSRVPLGMRRSTLSMTLLWITGATCFSTLYAGYTLSQGGFSLLDMLLASLVGNLILAIYWFGAAYLGARYGQSETLLARSFLGRSGSIIVSAMIIIATIGWYSVQANLLGEAITSLLHIPKEVAIISFGVGILMMFNNVMGFKSVTAWAQYVAAPLLILWVLWAFTKVFTQTPSSQLFASHHSSAAISFGVGASTFIGAIIWGSEPDFWRWSKPRPRTSIVPIVCAIVLGNVLFPLAGAALAETHNLTAFTQVITFVTKYTLGFSAIGIVIFVVTQVALNDMNLYQIATAAKNIFPGRRLIYVLIFGVIGSIFAYFQIINHYTTIAEMTGVLVPCVTVVMMVDAFVVPWMFRFRRNAEEVPAWHNTGLGNVPGLAAIAVGVVVGGFTGGIFVPSFTWGIGPLQAWLAAVFVYLGGVGLVRLTMSVPGQERILGFPLTVRTEVFEPVTSPPPIRERVPANAPAAAISESISIAIDTPLRDE